MMPSACSMIASSRSTALGFSILAQIAVPWVPISLRA